MIRNNTNPIRKKVVVNILKIRVYNTKTKKVSEKEIELLKATSENEIRKVLDVDERFLDILEEKKLIRYYQLPQDVFFKHAKLVKQEIIDN